MSERPRPRARQDSIYIGPAISAGSHDEARTWHRHVLADRQARDRARIDDENRRHDRATGGARVTPKAGPPA